MFVPSVPSFLRLGVQVSQAHVQTERRIHLTTMIAKEKTIGTVLTPLMYNTVSAMTSPRIHSRTLQFPLDYYS